MSSAGDPVTTADMARMLLAGVFIGLALGLLAEPLLQRLALP